MTVQTPCPACGASERTPRESAAPYEIFQCNACGLNFCDPMQAGDEAYYQGHVVYEKATESAARQQLASADHRANRRLLRMLPAGARTLDMGCGYGAFVALARRQGLDAHGVDFNAEQIEAGRRAYGLADRLHVGLVEKLPQLFVESSYDMVSLFEVIEHVERPRALLEQARRLLKPGGLLALSCPNEARWQPAGRIFVDYPPHHLTRWSPPVFGKLLAELGFEGMKVRIDASFRDILWTAYVNRSARNRSPGAPSVTGEAAPSGSRSWKHVVFDIAGVASAPADLVLRALGIGTMGMRILARRSAEGRPT